MRRRASSEASTTLPAPVFRPSNEEFSNPFLYISKIRAEAESCGICKIVPPAGWAPPFAIDRQAFRFPTRIQAVHELQDQRHSSAAAQAWQEDYQAWLKRGGRQLKKPPVYLGQEIDLARLYRVVAKRGGYEAVCAGKLWKDVSRALQVGMGGATVLLHGSCPWTCTSLRLHACAPEAP